MKKLRITGINYLNTKPFLWGLVTAPLSFKIDLQLDIPSACAQKLKNDEADIGLIPVAAIDDIPNAHIFSDFCIGTNGKVRTVSLLSNCPVEEITHVYLDYHSRTSVELVKILFKDFWKREVTFVAAEPGFENKIGGTVGGVIIGDRVIKYEDQFSFNYDLGESWLKLTGLPFTFAVWVSNKKIPTSIIKELNQALSSGLEKIDDLLIILPNSNGKLDLKYYFEHNISYHFDKAKKEALEKFLSMINIRKPQFLI